MCSLPSSSLFGGKSVANSLLSTLKSAWSRDNFSRWRYKFHCKHGYYGLQLSFFCYSGDSPYKDEFRNYMPEIILHLYEKVLLDCKIVDYEQSLFRRLVS